MSITLLASNYRGLAHVRLNLSVGLSALVGTNGAGKTTLGFVGDLLKRATASGLGDLSAAVEHDGGGRDLWYFGAAPDARIVLGVEAGETRWEIEPEPSDGGIAANPAERLTVGERIVFDRQADRSEVTWNGKLVTLKDDRTVLHRLPRFQPPSAPRRRRQRLRRAAQLARLERGPAPLRAREPPAFQGLIAVRIDTS